MGLFFSPPGENLSPLAPELVLHATSCSGTLQPDVRFSCSIGTALLILLSAALLSAGFSWLLLYSPEQSDLLSCICSTFLLLLRSKLRLLLEYL